MPRTSTEEDILHALSYPDTPYFITTSLYWDCDCSGDYIRRADMLMCEDCGAFRDEAPDSRLNEMKALSIHMDLHDPAVVATFEEHNTRHRSQHAPAP